jgi:hypothetical protein
MRLWFLVLVCLLALVPGTATGRSRTESTTHAN